MPARRPSRDPLMLRCGKPNCRCATGEPHESPALSFVQDGKAKTVTLTGADLDEVRAALVRYETAKAEIDRAADAGIAALRARSAARPRRRRA